MLDEASDAPAAACAIPGTATAAAPPAAMPRKARRFSELSGELVTSLRTPQAGAWLPTLSLRSVQFIKLNVTGLPSSSCPRVALGRPWPAQRHTGRFPWALGCGGERQDVQAGTCYACFVGIC